MSNQTNLLLFLDLFFHVQQPPGRLYHDFGNCMYVCAFKCLRKQDRLRIFTQILMDFNLRNESWLKFYRTETLFITVIRRFSFHFYFHLCAVAFSFK